MTELEGVLLPSHRAFYHAVPKQRWQVYQKREYLHWQQHTETLAIRQDFVQKFYVPLLQRQLDTLLSDKTRTRVLELGCGPVCTAQYLKHPAENTTYIDPLLDNYRRLFPAVLPEKSTYLAHLAEEVELPKHHYDMIICLNTLSDVHNPELVLNNMAGYLKPEGCLMISMDLWPSWLARLHCFFSRFLPSLPGFNRLYSYTRHGFVNSLGRHFNIVAVRRIEPSLHWLSFRQEWLFVCKTERKGRQG